MDNYAQSPQCAGGTGCYVNQKGELRLVRFANAKKHHSCCMRIHATVHLGWGGARLPRWRLMHAAIRNTKLGTGSDALRYAGVRDNLTYYRGIITALRSPVVTSNI